jgi:hypothetical protein
MLHEYVHAVMQKKGHNITVSSICLAIRDYTPGDASTASSKTARTQACRFVASTKCKHSTYLHQQPESP